MPKLENPGYLLREFCMIVLSHWPLGHNQFINTNFTKLITRISKPSHVLLSLRPSPAVPLCTTRKLAIFFALLLFSERNGIGSDGGLQSAVGRRRSIDQAPSFFPFFSSSCPAPRECHVFSREGDEIQSAGKSRRGGA